MSNISPKSFIITQTSSAISGSNAPIPNSSNQTSNVLSSIGIPSTNNYGTLSLVGLGTPTTKNTIDLQIQDSGTIVNEATFIWKDSAGTYDGTNDFRYMSGFRAPFSEPAYGATTNPIQACHGATAVYASFLQKEFLYYVKHTANRNVVHVAHRSVDGVNTLASTNEDTETYTLADITLPVRFQSASGDLAQVDVCETIEDTLLMVCYADFDLQLFESKDGLTWTRVASNLLKRFLNENVDFRTFNLTSLKIASSGSYVRIVCASKSSNHSDFFVLGSSDGGLSFKQLNFDSPINSDDAKVDEYANYQYAMDLCAIRPSDGSFMLVVGGVETLSNTTLPYSLAIPQKKIQTYIGIANNDFAAIEDNEILYENVKLGALRHAFNFQVTFGKIFLCKTDSHIYLFDTGRVPLNYPANRYYVLHKTVLNKQQMKFSQEVRVYRIPLDGLVSSNRWESLNQKDRPCDPDGEYKGKFIETGITSFASSCGRYWFGRSKFYFIGNAISCFGTMVDTENGGIITSRHQYFRMHTFTKCPLYDTFPSGYSMTALPNYAGEHQPDGALWQLQWQSMYGLPDGTYGMSDTPYTFSTTNGLAKSNAESTRLYVLNATGRVEFSITALKDLLSDEEGKETSAGFGGTLKRGGSVFECVFGKIVSNTTAASSLTLNRPFFIRIRDETIVDGSGTNEMVDFTIEVDTQNVYIYDTLTATRTSIIDGVASLGSGSTPFTTYEWEMRIAIEADATTTTFNNNAKVFLRRFDRSDYFTSGAVTISKGTGTATDGETFINLGLRGYTVTDPSPEVVLRSWGFHLGSSLGLLASDGTAVTADTSMLRGRNCNTIGTLTLQNNMRLAFGGGSGAEGDTFQLATQDIYSITSTSGSSLNSWQSASDASPSTIIYESNKNAFAHNGWGIFGLNCKEVKVEYSNDINFATGVNTIFTQNLSTGVVGRVTNVYEGNQTVEVSFDSFAGYQDQQTNGFTSTDKNNFYGRFTTLTGSMTNITLDQSFKIIDHYDNKLILDGSSDILTAAVGSTLTVFSDRIVMKEATVDNTIKKYFRLTLSGSTFEGVHKLGTVVAGQVIQFEVPMDWAYTDSENANIENNQSRSGVKWAYPEGPPVRTISGRIVGDVTQYERSKIRNALRKQQYSANPLVLVLEESSKQSRSPSNVLLARYTNEHSMDNAGWYYDTATETWYTVGDLSVTFEEDV